jgi:hypothetical protein
MDAHARNLGLTASALLAGGATLLCCVLPAVMVSLGAGAALVALISNFPQLVWLSEHKLWVFGIAGILLVVSTLMIWRARRLPCPADSVWGRRCARLRRVNTVLCALALLSVAAGATFAVLLPALAR